MGYEWEGHTSVPNLFSRVSPRSFLLTNFANNPAMMYDVCRFLCGNLYYDVIGKFRGPLKVLSAVGDNRVYYAGVGLAGWYSG